MFNCYIFSAVWKHTAFGNGSFSKWRRSEPDFGKYQQFLSLLKVAVKWSCSDKWLATTFTICQWLCSWDPCKRPTAVEVLQHPFFQVIFLMSFHTIRRFIDSSDDLTKIVVLQPCFYIPPSLRFRSTGYPATPPSGLLIFSDRSVLFHLSTVVEATRKNSFCSWG
jgi:serine/threonine protein kinase